MDTLQADSSYLGAGKTPHDDFGNASKLSNGKTPSATCNATLKVATQLSARVFAKSKAAHFLPAFHKSHCQHDLA